MALYVQKFGGTSLATIERIRNAAEIVFKAKEAGHDIVVIVSAMAGETDRLISLANAMSPMPSSREYAALVSTGEQVSMALMTIALEEKGLKALSYTGGQAGIYTSNQHKKARIQAINPDPILREMKAGKVVVIAGFQGIDVEGNITTLGRGGSDTTAVAIAAALKADECQIFTDVEGVYTTDPNVVPEARRLEQVTFEEMLELSSLGSKVLQIRSVEFAGKYNVPLRVLSSMNPGPGTLISYKQAESMEAPLVSGIAFSRHEAKIMLTGVPDDLGITSKLFAEVAEIGVNIDMMVQHRSPDGQVHLMFTVHKEEYPLTLAHFQKALSSLGAQSVTGIEHLAKLSLVGAGLKSHPRVAATLFNTLASEKISVQLVATSEIKLSVVIDADKLDQGVRALHKAFQLDKVVEEEIHPVVIEPPHTDEGSVVYSEN